MVPILLSALLVCIPAASGDNKTLRTAGNPHPAICGAQETNCALQGHPEICCPANTACYPLSHAPSPIFCCSLSFHACSSTLPLFCPLHTFPCPASLAGACCPVGLRCASSLCLEYEYKTQAVFSPSAAAATPDTKSPETFLYTLPATTIPAYTVLPIGDPLSEAAPPTCVPPNPDCQPGIPAKPVTDLPISDRVLGTPTAWRAKVGEVAVQSRASRDHNGRRRGCWKKWREERCFSEVVLAGVWLVGIGAVMGGL